MVTLPPEREAALARARAAEQRRYRRERLAAEQLSECVECGVERPPGPSCPSCGSNRVPEPHALSR